MRLTPIFCGKKRIIMYIFIKSTSIYDNNDNKFYQNFIKSKTMFLKSIYLFILYILVYGELSFVLSEF